MLYLSGCITQMLLQNPRADLGVMLQPGMGNDSKILPFLPWAADNGCFAQGEQFDVGHWLEWLGQVRRYRKTCLFAVCPDVVGDAVATYERRDYCKAIRWLGYKAAYVAQNGSEEEGAIPWDAFDVLFVGGTGDWKWSETMYGIAATAQRLGKSVHMGRVNSFRRMQALRVAGFDSADGTYVKYGPDKLLPTVYDWLDRVNGRTPLLLQGAPDRRMG